MKKTIYILLTILLMLLLSIILHWLIEYFYINYLISNDLIGNIPNRSCLLPRWLQCGLPIAAVIGGFFLGRHWWRIVYIEKRHWRFRKNR